MGFGDLTIVSTKILNQIRTLKYLRDMGRARE